MFILLLLLFVCVCMRACVCVRMRACVCIFVTNVYNEISITRWLMRTFLHVPTFQNAYKSCTANQTLIRNAQSPVREV